MGLFGNAPYSLTNLVKGVLAARANGEPYSGYKYALAFQQEEDEKRGRRNSPSVEDRVADASSESALRDASRRAIAKWHTQVGRDVQYKDGDNKVVVKSGYDLSTRKVTTDIIIYDRHSEVGRHLHVVIDDQGNVLHEKMKNNK